MIRNRLKWAESTYKTPPYRSNYSTYATRLNAFRNSQRRIRQGKHLHRMIHSRAYLSNVEHHWAVGRISVPHFSRRSSGSYHRFSHRNRALSEPPAGDCSGHSRPETRPEPIKPRETIGISSECSIVSCHNVQHKIPTTSNQTARTQPNFCLGGSTN